MSEHSNVATVKRMTKAVFDEDRETLSEIFSDDLQFHLRGASPDAGDHDGVDGFLGVLGAIFEATSGDIQLDQKFCLATDGWAAEWEHATLGRNGKHLESDNAFVYRFVDGRIAEMWMFLGATPELTTAFFA
ncbi:MAG TPA: nuclear transport factor 2 family protein [Acidimicrobiia bacterium]|nr:nuclear transport factor 2 family protein [Acidimicrobiia bacterium]